MPKRNTDRPSAHSNTDFTLNRTITDPTSNIAATSVSWAMVIVAVECRSPRTLSSSGAYM
jgi:hypothetical protein